MSEEEQEGGIGSRVYANLCMLDRTTPTWHRRDASMNYPRSIRTLALRCTSQLAFASGNERKSEILKLPETLLYQNREYSLYIRVMLVFQNESVLLRFHFEGGSREANVAAAIRQEGVKGILRSSFYGFRPPSGISTDSRYDGRHGRPLSDAEAAISVPDEPQTSRYPRQRVD